MKSEIVSEVEAQLATVLEALSKAGELCNILSFFNEHELHEELYWNVLSDDQLIFYINCNDVFAWGAADCERVTGADLPAIRQAIDNVTAIEDCREELALILWVARKRKARPQGTAYPKDRRFWPLFDACGPRARGGNGESV